jgi:RecB family endonuclease NucS
MIKSLLTRATPDKGQTIGKYGWGGEGKDHRNLKEHLAKHPDELGLMDITHREVEYGFISGDSADLVYWHKNGGITVIEIETNNPHPGAYQLIKYRALLCAEDGLSLHSHTVHPILVARSVPREVRDFCRKYGISWQEYRLP